MKILKFIPLKSIFAPEDPASLPEIIIEPNDRGGWSLRWETDAKQFGNYDCPQSAADIARVNFGRVRIVGQMAAAGRHAQLQAI